MQDLGGGSTDIEIVICRCTVRSFTTHWREEQLTPIFNAGDPGIVVGTVR